MTAYLIRHAHAGSRRDWQGEDQQRPLSDKGRRQALALCDLLRGEPIKAIYSSPAQRCVETTEPLADELGLTRHLTSVFGEGADPDVAIAWLLEHSDENPAVCSHGDLIPNMIGSFMANGMRTTDPCGSSKGSVWILEVENGRAVSGAYHPPG